MQDQIIEAIAKNSDLLDKILIGYVIWTIKGFATKFDLLVISVNNLNKSLAVSYEKHDHTESRTGNLEAEVKTLRDKHHDIVNNYVTQIELNAQNIKNIKEIVNGPRA